MVRLAPRLATFEELRRFHTDEHIQRVRRVSDSPAGGPVGIEVSISPGGYDIAALAAGGGLVAIDAVMTGKCKNAYTLLRPPGHHAVADSGMGFCVFNNIVLAALHAREVYGVRRIAIVDFDVHHGNGTQDAFYADPNVLFISIHQDRNWPHDTGI